MTIYVSQLYETLSPGKHDVGLCFEITSKPDCDV